MPKLPHILEMVSGNASFNPMVKKLKTCVTSKKSLTSLQMFQKVGVLKQHFEFCISFNVVIKN